MLEKIRAYSAKLIKSHNKISAQKPKVAVDLAAVTFYPSVWLWRGQLAIYAIMLVFSFLALLPFFFSLFYALPLWLMFIFFIGMAIRKSHREKNAPRLSFEITNNQWRLTTQTGSVVVGLLGEVVLWSWLIIIPVRDNQTQRRYCLIALPDSLEQEQWRRLRVWLKTCL